MSGDCDILDNTPAAATGQRGPELHRVELADPEGGSAVWGQGQSGGVLSGFGLGSR